MMIKICEDVFVFDCDDLLVLLCDQFLLFDGVIYFDGNLFGVQLCVLVVCVQQVIGVEWGEGLICSWNMVGWFVLLCCFGDKFVMLIGGVFGEMVVIDIILINLFKLLLVMLCYQVECVFECWVIVLECLNFLIDLYIVQGLIDQFGGGYMLCLIDDLVDLFGVFGVDMVVVMIMYVNYCIGYMYDMLVVIQLVYDVGVLMLWDFVYLVGVVLVDLNGVCVDGVVGCMYKYLNGGFGLFVFVWVL